MAVRSKRLFGPVAVVASSIVVYTAPAGETAIIKTLAITNTAVVNNVVGVFLNGNATVNRIALYSLSVADNPLITDLFLVLQPGDTLRFNFQTAGANVAGFGAELEGVAD